MLHAIIMAGGAGTRFWPASRGDHPKQLISMTGGPTMIQSTVGRMQDLCPMENVRIFTNQRLVEKIKKQLPQIPADSIVGEPCKRDTAPCIGLAAAMVHAIDEQGTMVVMPSDHVISTDSQFQESIRYAVELVEANPDRLVTFGIKPDYPATAFGYVERGQPLSSNDGELNSYEVSRFREKPDLATAEQFIEQGTFYWNSGIFVWKAKTILSALKRLEPKMAGHIETIGNALGTEDFDAVLDREFQSIEGKSIDFAVMEHYDPVCVVEAPFAWNDVGNWTALERLIGQDQNQNTLVGHQLTIDSQNCIVKNDPDDGHLLVTVGMENCIVIRTADATMVVDKSAEADIKKVVSELENQGWTQYL